jgi:hypothetical protein
MKIKRMFLFVLSLIFLSIIFACKEKNVVKPCDGNGTLCINNKTDSSVIIEIVEAHNTFTLDKNSLQCVQLKGDQLYTINIDGYNFYKDTSLMVLTCDRKDFVILR